ncbi:MAG: UbiA family prenyltransferase [Phycisphaerae bacterium]|nr:UbiA family prenyltransferase [Phycisphaerae bacterium]
MVTLSTATGYLLAAGRLTPAICQPVLGVFLLASGAAALNQCQDAPLDALMPRTRRRPIPSGRLDRAAAAFIAALLALLGLYVLVRLPGRSMPMLALGCFALAWYNGLYALLKRVTAFAVVPGALIGAVGPLIGWIAAGGSPRDPLILAVAAFFFVWQIPHFWLLMLLYGHEYAAAHLPTPTTLFSRPQLARITFMWTAAAAAAAILLPVLARSRLPAACSLALVANSIWLVLAAAPLLFAPDSPEEASGTAGSPEPGRRALGCDRFRRAFIRINIFALLAMTCLVAGALL